MKVATKSITYKKRSIHHMIEPDQRERKNTQAITTSNKLRIFNTMQQDESLKKKKIIHKCGQH